MTTLLLRQQAYIDRWRQRGGRVLSYTTPCCQKLMETTAPGMPGDTWDSLTTCPHCGRLYMKIVTYGSAVGVLPKEEE